MKRYFEAPEYFSGPRQHKTIFLGGGITNCEDWQTPTTNTLMEKSNFIVFNPRRKNFDLNDKNASTIQIEWEYRHLRLADILIFWFPKTSICPITLFEYGYWLSKDKPLYLGIEDGYTREFDLRFQTEMEKGREQANKMVFSDLSTMISCAIDVNNKGEN